MGVKGDTGGQGAKVGSNCVLDRCTGQLVVIYSDSDLLSCKTPTGTSHTSMDGWFQDRWLRVIWK